MNAMIKVAALAALLSATAAFADQNDPATTGERMTDYSKLDTNADGSVSKDEASADPTLAARFAELDTDKNGSLSSSELKKAGEKKGKEEY